MDGWMMGKNKVVGMVGSGLGALSLSHHHHDDDDDDGGRKKMYDY
jgi:hypothetical protein